MLLANTVGVSTGLYYLLSNEKVTKTTDKPDERTAASERYLSDGPLATVRLITDLRRGHGKS